MSTPSAVAPGEIVPNESPLRFKSHSFQAHRYNTIGCIIIYNHSYQVEDAEDRIAPPPRGPDYQKAWGSVELGIENFPPPAQVSWKSLDSVQHEAKVDFAAIFKDRKVLHHVPEQDIPEGWAHDIPPEIHLEVNGRTINVYMRAYIATKQLQKPGNPNSDFRDDLILAWTHTY